MHLVGSQGLVHVGVPQVVSNLISLSAERTLLPQSLLWEERLLLSTEAKKLLGTSISFHVLLQICQSCYQGDALSVTLFFWLMYLYKPFLLFFASPAKFSCIHIGQLNKVGSI